jgi:hypothetical protein
MTAQKMDGRCDRPVRLLSRLGEIFQVRSGRVPVRPHHLSLRAHAPERSLGWRGKPVFALHRSFLGLVQLTSYAGWVSAAAHNPPDAKKHQTPFGT